MNKQLRQQQRLQQKPFFPRSQDCFQSVRSLSQLRCRVSPMLNPLRLHWMRLKTNTVVKNKPPQRVGEPTFPIKNWTQVFTVAAKKPGVQLASSESRSHAWTQRKYSFVLHVRLILVRWNESRSKKTVKEVLQNVGQRWCSISCSQAKARVLMLCYQETKQWISRTMTISEGLDLVKYNTWAQTP